MKDRTNQGKQTSFLNRDIPKMPEGYYSGDKPNPNLRNFVEQHLKERPYNPETDDYDVPPFNEPITTTKATAIYNMHTYWSKKPHDAIRQYIRHYTKPGDLVLDPFCGSGGTALAALMEDRKAIAIDRSPAATFITKNYCTPVDVEELQKAFEELKRKVKPEMDWLYETRCDRCGGKATTAYTVYSQVFQCQRCLEKVPLFDCVEIEGKTAQGKDKKISVCPHCFKKGITEEISTRAEKYGSIPVMVSYHCKEGCKPIRGERRHNDGDRKKREYFEKYDLAKIKEIEEKKIPHWYPDIDMIKGHETCVKRDLSSQGVYKVCDLFTKRNLWALALIIKEIGLIKRPNNDVLRFVATSFLLNLSKLYKFRDTGGGQPTGNYYIPQVNRENEAWASFERKFQDIIEAYSILKEFLHSPLVMISTQNAGALNAILSNSVDHIFTDPPYAGKYQYGELNYVWEAWLEFDTSWHKDEITVNEYRGISEEDWALMMTIVMTECFRILKPGRWLALCYHDTSEGTWSLIQDIMAEVGFLPDKNSGPIYIDTGQKTYNQSQAEKVTRRDLVINFRKPKPGELTSSIAITGDEDPTTFNEKVCQIIRDYLGAHPGIAKDRIYDEVVSRMVRSGQMEAHDFEGLLRQVADEVKTARMKTLFDPEDPDLFGGHEMGRWYLKENELALQDENETTWEDAASDNLSAFITEYCRQHPEVEGVHYSDLFERYVYAVKDKPRRPLAEWLPDYFYKTDSGTWRLPTSPEEERFKAEGRAKGLNRRVKRYLAWLDQGIAVSEQDRPNASTLAEWIHHCRRNGLYEQGKLLYEKGGLDTDALSDEAAVAVDEDYQVCVRMLERSAGAAPGKAARGRKKRTE